MAITTVGERGRILIPKKIRDEMGLRGGESVRLYMDDDQLIIKKAKPIDEFKKLKGCITQSDVDPLDLKKMWGM